MKKFRIASFDIGKVNFAQYIEEVDVDKILLLENEYKSLPKKLQRKTKGEVTPQMQSILDKLYLSGTRINTGVYDIGDKNSIKEALSMETRRNLICHLESFREMWDTCNIFIIEQQYFRTWSGGIKKRKTGGSEANINAIKIAEGVVMWFLCEYPLKEVLFFGSQNKTQILGAPWNLSKGQRKKWASEECRRLYEYRNDKSMIDLFNLEDSVFMKRLISEEKIQSFLNLYDLKNSEDGIKLAEKVVRKRQKLDDISDACLQAQAFKFKTMVACF